MILIAVRLRKVSGDHTGFLYFSCHKLQRSDQPGNGSPGLALRSVEQWMKDKEDYAAQLLDLVMTGKSFMALGA